MRGLGVVCLVSCVLFFVGFVQAHSWVQCVDYTEENGRNWDANKCRAWPRDYWEQFQYVNPPYLFGGDAGYNVQPSENSPCKTTPKGAGDYNSVYPKASYSPGQKVCLAWPPKNHVAAACNNPNIGDFGTKVYRSGPNPTSDPTLSQFRNTLVADLGTNTGQSGIGFQNCPNFCADPDKCLCTGCFNIPNDLTVGASYTFIWLWAFNSATDLYSTCWDVNIVANSGNTVTSTLPHITPDAYKAALQVSTTNQAGGNGGGGATSTSSTTGTKPAGTTTTTTGSNSGGGGASGGNIIFNGNFNQYSTNTDFDQWSFATPGNWEYQAYIYGNANSANKMSTFVSLSSAYQNTRDGGAHQGVKIQVNSNSVWNSNTQLQRTELVAVLPSDAKTGVRYYHFSIAQGATNTFDPTYEHQIMFFEAHFAGNFGNNLNFVPSNGQSVWTTPFGNNVWHNFAIYIDFSGNKVGLYHSTGSDPLVQVVGPTASSPSQSDFHVGFLRVAKNGQQSSNAEDLMVCSVYVSDALLSFTGGSGSAPTPAPYIAPTPAPTPANNSAPTPANSAPTPANSAPTPANSAPTPANSAPTPANSAPTPANSAPTPSTIAAPTPAPSNTGTPTDCNVGSEKCACTKGGACDAGLVCASQICVNPKTIQGYISDAPLALISFTLVV